MLRLLADEHVHGGLVSGIRQRQPEVDILSVQEAGLNGMPDPDLLSWAAREGRIVISEDRRTLIRHANARVAAAQDMPGVFILRKGMSSAQMIDELLLVIHCSEPSEWKDRIEHLPL